MLLNKMFSLEPLLFQGHRIRHHTDCKPSSSCPAYASPRDSTRESSEPCEPCR